jgi:glycosyltransferase involved in cell wall biosynthesis
MTPRIAVVVPTRNRPHHAEPCVRSILANRERDLELVLVDQSDEDTTERAVAVHRLDSRFRHLRSATRGASNARNIGIQASLAPIIAFTDDDCRVAVDWIARMIRALSAGFKVVNAVEAQVSHLGVRDGRNASKLYRGYGLAMGAMFAKHVRIGTAGSLGLLISWLTHFGARGVANALHGRRPTGLGLVGGMLSGASRSVGHRIDRSEGIYVEDLSVALRPEPTRRVASR